MLTERDSGLRGFSPRSAFIRAVLHVTQYYINGWFSHVRDCAPSLSHAAVTVDFYCGGCGRISEVQTGFVVAEYHGLPLTLICDQSERALIGSAVNMLQICCSWSGLRSKCLSVITDTVQYTRVFLFSCFYAAALILKKLQICPTNKAAARTLKVVIWLCAGVFRGSVPALVQMCQREQDWCRQTGLVKYQGKK